MYLDYRIFILFNCKEIFLDTKYSTMYNYNGKGGAVSQLDKLLKRITSMSKDMRFSELKKVLEKYGYAMHVPKGGSSHVTFRKKGCFPITIPKHEPIKKVYVEKVKRVIESEGENENS